MTRMEEAVRALTILSLKARLSACERESAALAREVLSPSTTATRRAEILILRAAVQSRSVALWRDLEQLEMEEQTRPLIERRIHMAKTAASF